MYFRGIDYDWAVKYIAVNDGEEERRYKRLAGSKVQRNQERGRKKKPQKRTSND